MSRVSTFIQQRDIEKIRKDAMLNTTHLMRKNFSWPEQRGATVSQQIACARSHLPRNVEFLNQSCHVSIQSNQVNKAEMAMFATADRRGSYAEQSIIEGLSSFAIQGEINRLPDEVQSTIKNIAYENGLDCARPSDRCLAMFGWYHDLDRMAWGRTAINMSHVITRNLASVMLPTVARQAVGNLLDSALQRGLDEARRTALGTMFMAVPVVGQLVLGVADELQGRSTNYSRATRAVMMGLSLATGGAALATHSMLNPGMRFAETILYPLLRDLIQTAIPIISNSEVGPTKSSLLVAGTIYAANQLGVSRGFVNFPDWLTQAEGGGRLSVKGLMGRGVINAAGEVLDLYTLCMSNHFFHNGKHTEQPQLRMRIAPHLLQSCQDRNLLNVMFSRGNFVSSFNQFYDSMLATGPLANTLNAILGRLPSSVAIDWITEAAVALLTVITYPFWPDPLHQREVDLQQASNLNISNDHSCVQQCGEPGLADSLALRQNKIQTISVHFLPQ